MGNIKNELRNYQSIPRELVFDSSVSDRARFVYIFMACKPEDWDFYLEPMSKEIGYSIDTLRKYLSELVDSGWLEKGEQSKENGEFRAVKYTIKTTNFSDTEKTRHGKIPTQDNNSIPNTKYTNKEIKDIKENKKKTLDLSCVSSEMKPLVDSWLAYKREKGQTYKQKGFSVFYKRLLQISDNNPEIAKIIIEKSMACNYSGIFPLNDEEKKSIQTPAAEMTLKEKFENFLVWLRNKRGEKAMYTYRISIDDFREMLKAYPDSAKLCFTVLRITEKPVKPNEKLIDVFRKYHSIPSIQ